MGGLIETTQVGYGEFNARDFDALFARLTPDFVWNEAAEIPGPKSSVTRDEFVRFMRGFDRLWDEFRFEPLTLTECAADADGDQVVYVKVRAHGRGKASEEEGEFDIHHVWRLRDGLFARMDAYLEEGEALEAAGLISET
jgi:ketosteroid isomerase-like protein